MIIFLYQVLATHRDKTRKSISLEAKHIIDLLFFQNSQVILQVPLFKTERTHYAWGKLYPSDFLAILLKDRFASNTFHPRKKIIIDNTWLALLESETFLG